MSRREKVESENVKVIDWVVCSFDHTRAQSIDWLGTSGEGIEIKRTRRSKAENVGLCEISIIQ